MEINALKHALDYEMRSSRAASPLFDADADHNTESKDAAAAAAAFDPNAAQTETKNADEAASGTRIDDLVPDFYSITLERLSRAGSRAGSRAASPDPEFRFVKLRKTPSRENVALEDEVRVKLSKATTNLRKTGSLYNLEARSRQGSRASSPVRDAAGGGGGGEASMGMPPITHLLAKRPGWSKSGSRAGSKMGSRAGSRAGSPEKENKQGSRKSSVVSSTTTTTTEDFAAVKLKKSKMSKAEHSKFQLESVDLHGFSLNKKSASSTEAGEDIEYESSTSGRAPPMPRPPPAAPRDRPALKKSGSTSRLRDAADKDAGNEEAPQSTEDVLTAAKGILMKGKKTAEEEEEEERRLRLRRPKAREAEEEEEEKIKLRPLKKTPSIQALYQSQEIETEFKMTLPPKEEDGPTKVVLQLPGLQ